MSNSNTDPVWPVLVTIRNGRNSTALMNRKAYRKSTETGMPWIVHPATGRVLPWPGEPAVLSLTESTGCFLLELPTGSSVEPYGSAAPPEVDPDDRSDMDAATLDAAAGEAVMDSLSVLIARRHREMPEGSYTTHLFEKGLDKIRKKAGEEAIELLLAREDRDVIYESADLVYHLLVLLEASDLTWSDVTSELQRRHDT